MTLAQTTEQILLLEEKLENLNDTKKQLFLQLKKVVNEDMHRREQ